MPNQMSCLVDQKCAPSGSKRILKIEVRQRKIFLETTTEVIDTLPYDFTCEVYQSDL